MKYTMLRKVLLAAMVGVGLMRIAQSGTPIAASLDSIANSKPLIQKVFKDAGRAELIPMVSEKVPGLNEAVRRLGQPECAKAVGGEFERYAQTRVTTTNYFVFAIHVIGAEESLYGGSRIIFAISYIEARRVLLLPPFMKPDAVATRLLTGKVARLNELQDFERIHGLKTGSMNVRKMQSIALLHEQAHLNGSAIEDLACLVLSMINTRQVAEACYPESVDQLPPSLNGLNLQPRQVFLRIRTMGKRGCLICHSSNRAKVVK